MLRDLKKDNDWKWSKKVLIASDTKLSYFNPEQETWIQCDASSYGLGGVLLQSGKPVYHACKSLTAAEQNYS